MKHLIDIESISQSDILDIIESARQYKNGQNIPNLQHRTAALMFYENSTRTKCSFEIAGKKLGMNVINFDTAHSSLSKGESLKDTVENLYALGVDIIIIRHSLSGIIYNILNQIKCPIQFVNAGDGTRSHPTQALLDFFTITEKIKTAEGKKITIVGDITHSRVAKSNIKLLSKFGADIHVCAPSYMNFKNPDIYNITYHQDLKSAIKDADVVMALRIQNERHEKEGYPDSAEYKRLYGINSELFSKYAAKNAILMHPGPVNTDIELTAELLESKAGETILEQAHNGVFVRMAILNNLINQKGEG
ncbi:MAG: aspartate carbamoyltransferase catalytic subunit [Candidatus Gastranaerophilales bacterium]|nr:aspartate carbamoyltransferase catalytic subunit [Candidatus Gastranaerophilales bacterium]